VVLVPREELARHTKKATGKPPMSTVRIGTHPINWSNDDLPELGGETPLETCLAEARHAGFTGIELGNKFPRDAAALGPIMAAHGLELVSGWYGAELRKRTAEEEIAAMTPHLELLAAMGGAMVNVGVRGSGGDLLLGSLHGLTVAEADALDHLGEPLRAVQPAPAALGRLGQLVDHRP
jgi:sugar phosphate isomerase/epimerase